MHIEFNLLSKKTGRTVFSDHLPEVLRKYYLEDAVCHSASIPSGEYIFQYIIANKYVLQYYHFIANEDDEMVMETNLPTPFLIVPTMNYLKFKIGHLTTPLCMNGISIFKILFKINGRGIKIK